MQLTTCERFISENFARYSELSSSSQRIKVGSLESAFVYVRKSDRPNSNLPLKLKAWKKSKVLQPAKFYISTVNREIANELIEVEKIVIEASSSILSSTEGNNHTIKPIGQISDLNCAVIVIDGDGRKIFSGSNHAHRNFKSSEKLVSS